MLDNCHLKIFKFNLIISKSIKKYNEVNYNELNYNEVNYNEVDYTYVCKLK